MKTEKLLKQGVVILKDYEGIYNAKSKMQSRGDLTRHVSLLGIWHDDIPLFREDSKYWNPLEREEHVFVFTCRNYFARARKPKSKILLQAQTLNKIKCNGNFLRGTGLIHK